MAVVVASQQELDAAVTLGQVLDWASVDGDPAVGTNLRGAFLLATGATVDTLPRIFGVIDAADFDSVINQVTINTGTVDVPVATPCNLFQRGALISVGLFCRAKLGLGGQPPVAAIAALPPPPLLAPVVVDLRAKTKLSLIIKQGDDTEVPIIDDDVFTLGNARWEKLFGVNARPSPDIECTAAQLTCLKHLIDTKQAPTVDFAIWGPHGNRLERKLRLTGAVFDKDGSMIMIEIAGPPNLATWLLSWEVYATGCIMLNIIDLGVLLDYKAHILALHARYGPQAWLLLYQAETRFRSEHLPRTKRILGDAHTKAVDAGGTTAFVADRPWSLAMATGLVDRSWWAEEFSEAAMMLLARTSSLDAFVANDAPVQGGGGRHVVAPPLARAAPDGHRRGGDDAGQTVKKKNRVDMSVVTNGEYSCNRSGKSLCSSYQTGACGPSVGDRLCPQDRTKVHQCSLCLDGSHGKHQCHKSGAAPINRSKGGGKAGGKAGKAKGKGKHPW